ncbi:MAG: SAM-dependent methyltransferase, partial [Stenotrophomonas sp.]|nr:SAM-dependent methyltransferase [Stenotrophomonas sp.]
MPHYSGPLLTRESATALQRAADAGAPSWTGSLDLGRSEETVGVSAEG